MNHAKSRTGIGKRLVVLAFLALVLAAPQVRAAEEITGDWEMTMEFGGRQSFATLSISRNADGGLSGPGVRRMGPLADR